MYHDQGIAPFKAINFGSGANFTAGLPVIRTTIDHGTAYEIAGLGKASENSFRQAIYLAHNVYHNRQLNAEMSKNQLKDFRISE